MGFIGSQDLGDRMFMIYGALDGRVVNDNWRKPLMNWLQISKKYWLMNNRLGGLTRSPLELRFVLRGKEWQ
jgi:hypothetical protein